MSGAVGGRLAAYGLVRKISTTQSEVFEFTPRIRIYYSFNAAMKPRVAFY